MLYFIFTILKNQKMFQIFPEVTMTFENIFMVQGFLDFLFSETLVSIDILKGKQLLGIMSRQIYPRESSLARRVIAPSSGNVLFLFL